MSLNVEIKLSRLSKVYNEGDVLHGAIQVTNTTGSDAKFEAILCTCEGAVTLQFGNRSAGPFEAFTSSAKTIPLLHQSATVAGGGGSGGHFTAGLNEFPFEFPLTALRDPNCLYETYHGVFVSINYSVRCEVRRSFLAKSLSKQQQFVVQQRPVAAPLRRPSEAEVNFTISPESMAKTAKERIAIPRFLITGRLEQSDWCVSKPIRGQLTVQHTEVAIKSIELQLIRVETSGCVEGAASDGKNATEIQNIQIADGNICAKLPVPIHMILPRLFVCPALKSKNFKVDFEINLVIAFQDNYCVSENFKIPLSRFT